MMQPADLHPPEERTRRGHAARDLSLRDLKAIKIARLIGADPGQPARRMLESGTGSGGIAHYFGTAGAMGWDVEAIDVEDVRAVADGYRFTRVDSVSLPLPEASFDVVVSNHVIEHVGDARQQARHLAEMARVLRRGGVAYLAVPSRRMLVESHFRLPFFSWLPQSLADAYVRFAGKGSHYDCSPLTVPRIESALRAAGFDYAQQHGTALRVTFALERPDSRLYRWVLKPIPESLYACLRQMFPTLINMLKRRPELG